MVLKLKNLAFVIRFIILHYTNFNATNKLIRGKITSARDSTLWGQYLMFPIDVGYLEPNII